MNKFYVNSIKELGADTLPGVGAARRFAVETSWLPLTVWLSLDSATLYFRPDNQMSRYVATAQIAPTLLKSFRVIAHKTPKIHQLPLTES